jgi:hypothetical protein
VLSDKPLLAKLHQPVLVLIAATGLLRGEGALVDSLRDDASNDVSDQPLPAQFWRTRQIVTLYVNNA